VVVVDRLERGRVGRGRNPSGHRVNMRNDSKESDYCQGIVPGYLSFEWDAGKLRS
jgi:hypothetical protein